MDFWRKLPPRMRLLVVTGFVALMVAVGAQFHVSSQGDRSSTYPKGYRGGTCTIETETLLVGYSATSSPMTTKYRMTQPAPRRFPSSAVKCQARVHSM